MNDLGDQETFNTFDFCGILERIVLERLNESS